MCLMQRAVDKTFNLRNLVADIASVSMQPINPGELHSAIWYAFLITDWPLSFLESQLCSWHSVSSSFVSECFHGIGHGVQLRTLRHLRPDLITVDGRTTFIISHRVE